MSDASNSVFSLQESLIVCGRDLSASRAPFCWEALSDERVQYAVGIIALEGDESVHADQWECHPAGDEVLSVLEGRLLVSVDCEDTLESVVVDKGKAFIVPRGHWHRLRVLEPGLMMFFTPTVGTTVRPRPARSEIA